MRRSLGDFISSKQQCKRFAINSSFIVLARVDYIKIITLLFSPRSVIDAVQNEASLNQIARLRRKLTIIDDGHVGM